MTMLRKYSKIVAAAAIVPTTVALVGTPLASAQATSAVNIDLGKDAAGAEIVMIDSTGTETSGTADDDGVVTLDYNGTPQELEIQIGDKTLTLESANCTPAAGGAPTTPAPTGDPSDPVDPTDPVDPMPTDPVDPTGDPTDPTDPTGDPTDPTDPTGEPTDPTDPTDPTGDPTDPTTPDDGEGASARIVPGGSTASAIADNIAAAGDYTAAEADAIADGFIKAVDGKVASGELTAAEGETLKGQLAQTPDLSALGPLMPVLEQLLTGDGGLLDETGLLDVLGPPIRGLVKSLPMGEMLVKTLLPVALSMAPGLGPFSGTIMKVVNKILEDPNATPTAEPTDPTGAPTDPTGAPTDPTGAPTDPTGAPTDPIPVDPIVDPGATIPVTTGDHGFVLAAPGGAIDCTGSVVAADVDDTDTDTSSSTSAPAPTSTPAPAPLDPAPRPVAPVADKGMKVDTGGAVEAPGFFEKVANIFK